MGFFGFGKSKASTSIDWVNLDSIDLLNELIEGSNTKPVLFLKHSTRCSISSMALSRLENYWDIEEDALTPVYLDLIKYRDVSNEIAHVLNVMHQSPQILLVKDGKCIYQASHNEISVDSIKSKL